MRVVRILILLMTAALVGCDDQRDLVQVPSQKVANRILVVLGSQGVAADVVDRVDRRSTAYAIRVAPTDLEHARAILDQFNLPPDDRGGFDAMLAERGLIPTANEERARLMHAMAIELERTFEVCAGVVEARVHVVIPEVGLVSDPEDQEAPTALVLLKVLGEPPTHCASENDGDDVCTEHQGADDDIPAPCAVRRMVRHAVDPDATVEVAFTRAVTPGWTLERAETVVRDTPVVTNEVESANRVLVPVIIAMGALAVLTSGLWLRERRRHVRDLDT